MIRQSGNVYTLRLVCLNTGFIVITLYIGPSISLQLATTLLLAPLSHWNPSATGSPLLESTRPKKPYDQSCTASPSVPVGLIAPRSPMVKVLFCDSKMGDRTSVYRAGAEPSIEVHNRA